MGFPLENSYGRNQNFGHLKESKLRSLSLSPQAVTTSPSPVNLGFPHFITGDAIIQISPNTVILGFPGLYYVNIAGDFTITNISDRITIQPTINNNAIVGSQLIVSNIPVGTATSFTKSFFVSVYEPGSLSFNQTGSVITDTINTFALTVIKL